MMVSEIAFGGASISGEGAGYGFGLISESDAISLLHEAKDLGINIFDSAPIYGFGLSEKRMGKAFKAMRDDVYLVSKSGIDWHDNKRVNLTNDPKVTQKMLEQSLRDFQTDMIDIFMIHWPDERVDIRRPLEVLAKAKEQGKIRHVGLCNSNEEDLVKSQEILSVDVVQSEFNFFNTKASEALGSFLDNKIGSFMSWGTLDKGIMTGKHKKNQHYDESDCRRGAVWWKQEEVNKKIDQIEKLRPYVETRGHSLIEFALGYNLSHDFLGCALVGSKNSKQLQSTIKAYENRVSAEDIQAILSDYENS